MSVFYSLLADSVLHDNTFFLSQVLRPGREMARGSLERTHHIHTYIHTYQDSLMREAYAVDKSYTGYAKKVNAGFDISALSEDAHTRRLFEQRAARTLGHDHEPDRRDRGGHNAGGDRASGGYRGERDGCSDGQGNGGGSRSGRFEQDFDVDAGIPEEEDVDVDEDHDEDFDEDEDVNEDWEETAQPEGSVRQ
jgi:hypothetical protein